jgi:hypothetical protein
MKVSARVDNDGGGSSANGGELLCLALATCYCNDVYREAKKRGIGENPASAINAEVVEGLFPGDAEVQFRTPYEMYDPGALRQLLDEAGTQLLSGRTRSGQPFSATLRK